MVTNKNIKNYVACAIAAVSGFLFASIIANPEKSPQVAYSKENKTSIKQLRYNIWTHKNEMTRARNIWLSDRKNQEKFTNYHKAIATYWNTIKSLEVAKAQRNDKAQRYIQTIIARWDAKSDLEIAKTYSEKARLFEGKI